MARWKLVEPHYIHAERDGQRPEWVYKEINRATGREIQKKYIIPMHLDPKLAEDWNDWPDGPHGDGIVVVTDGKNARPKDIIMVPNAKGELPITPGMEPLDDEAREITAKFAHRFTPIEGREDATYSERLVDHFVEQLADVKAAATQQANTAGINDVLKVMTEMLAQNQQILKLVADRQPEKRKVA